MDPGSLSLLSSKITSERLTDDHGILWQRITRDGSKQVLTSPGTILFKDAARIELLDKDTTLLLKNVKLEDAGNYSCRLLSQSLELNHLVIVRSTGKFSFIRLIRSPYLFQWDLNKVKATFTLRESPQTQNLLLLTRYFIIFQHYCSTQHAIFNFLLLITQLARAFCYSASWLTYDKAMCRKGEQSIWLQCKAVLHKNGCL